MANVSIRQFGRLIVLCGLAALVAGCESGPRERRASTATTISKDREPRPHTLQGVPEHVRPGQQVTPFDMFPVTQTIALDNGVMIEVLRSGTSDKVVIPTSIISVRYWGMLENGRIFDQTDREEFTRTFPLERLIEGWQSALPGMRVGSVWRLRIPSALAYGESGLEKPRIPPDADLTYVIQLADVE